MKKFYSPLAFTQKLFAVVILVILNFHTYGQTVVSVGGGTTGTCPFTPTATWTTPPAVVSFGNWSRGAGVQCASVASALTGSNFISASASASMTANKYYSVTLTAAAGNGFVLNNVVWKATAVSGTSRFDVQYSNNGGALTSFGATAQVAGSTSPTETFTGNVFVAGGTSIILYLIPWGNIAATLVQWKNTSTITVTPVSALPASGTAVVNGAYVIPSGLTGPLTVDCYGAGGGGGAAYANDNTSGAMGAASGGGGGAYAFASATVTAGQIILVSVGTGGAGNNGLGANGTAGGASSVINVSTGTTLALAAGGGGGTGANATDTYIYNLTGGAGGSTGTGTIKAGGTGGTSLASGVNNNTSPYRSSGGGGGGGTNNAGGTLPVPPAAGAGGATGGGNGGAGGSLNTTSSITGTAGSTYGGGGGGAVAWVTVSGSVNNANGGNGANGGVVIKYCTTTPPTAPGIGSTTPATCAVQTASVDLNGLPSPGSWTITSTPGAFTVSGSGTTGTISGLTAGQSYTFVVNVGGCYSPASTSASIAAAPVIPAAPSVTTPVTYCQNATATALTATGSNLLWYTGATGGTGSSTAIIPVTTTAGTPAVSYWVSQTTSCESPRAQISVNVNPVPAGLSTSTGGPVCTPNSLTLNAGGTTMYSYLWTGPGSTGNSGQIYHQNFDKMSTGTVTWIDDQSIPGWYLSSGSLSLAASNGTTSTANRAYNFGTTGTGDRALGYIPNATANYMAVKLTNNTGAAVTSLFVTYSGEEWREQTGAAGSLVFSYAINPTNITTGTYSPVTALNFTAPVTGTAVALPGNANSAVKTSTITGLNLLAGQSIWLRWAGTATGTASTQYGLAIDDLTAVMFSGTPLTTPTTSVTSGTTFSLGYTSTDGYTIPTTTTANNGTYTLTAFHENGCPATKTVAASVNAPTTWYQDADGDGFGNIAVTTLACTQPVGYVANSTDCAPADGTKWQTATLYIDNDNDNYDNGTAPVCYGASIPAGYKATTLGTDCDDNNAAVNPGAVEICGNGIDDNCNGQTDEGCGPNTWQGDVAGNLTNWFNAGNWSNNTVPNSCASDVIIPTNPSGGNNFPVISTGSVQVRDITVQSGAQITITGQTLSVCGNWTGSTGAASQVLGTGTVILTGGGSPQNLYNASTFQNLTVNNPNGVLLALSSSFDIFGELKLQSGIFNTTNGTVTLKSNATGTALLNNFGSNTGTYTGNLTVERYIANPAKGYRDLSSPVATTVADLSDDFTVFGQDAVKCWYAYNPYPNVQVYDEALSLVNGAYYEGWLSYTGTANPLTPMKGIAARTYVGGATGQPYTIDLTGVPNNGPQAINITKTTSGTTTQDGWNFVGNPYPSPIDWVQVAALNLSITGSYYIFQTSNEYAGGWGTCNSAGACTGTMALTRYITSGQGFFVQATGTGSFVMNNTVRTNNTANFYKTEELSNEVRLSLTGSVDHDEILAYTDINATASNDQGLDAQKIAAGSTVYLSFDMPGIEYSINVLSDITEQTELPLILWVTDDGSYTFSAPALNLTGLTAWLKDAQSNTLYDLSTVSPSLALTGGQTYSGRYSIVFKTAPVTAIVDPDKAAVKIYANGKTVFVERPSASAATISISNILGQQLTGLVSHQEKTEIPVSFTEMGYAFVKVTEGNRVSTAKVLINNK